MCVKRGSATVPELCACVCVYVCARACGRVCTRAGAGGVCVRAAMRRGHGHTHQNRKLSFVGVSE